MLCRFNVTILVLCLCNCSQYYFGYYMFTVALHPPSSLSSQISLETLYEMEGWGVNKKTFKGKCMFPHAVSVQAFPFLISHHCQWSPYALGTGKLFDLEGGLWSCICKKLILQSYSCFIEVCSGGEVVIKTQISIEFLHKLGNKKRNAIQLSRHKVWYAH